MVEEKLRMLVVQESLVEGNVGDETFQCHRLYGQGAAGCGVPENRSDRKDECQEFLDVLLVHLRISAFLFQDSKVSFSGKTRLSKTINHS